MYLNIIFYLKSFYLILVFFLLALNIVHFNSCSLWPFLLNPKNTHFILTILINFNLIVLSANYLILISSCLCFESILKCLIETYFILILLSSILKQICQLFPFILEFRTLIIRLKFESITDIKFF